MIRPGDRWYHGIYARAGKQHGTKISCIACYALEFCTARRLKKNSAQSAQIIFDSSLQANFTARQYNL